LTFLINMLGKLLRDWELFRIVRIKMDCHFLIWFLKFTFIFIYIGRLTHEVKHIQFWVSGNIHRNTFFWSQRFKTQTKKAFKKFGNKYFIWFEIIIINQNFFVRITFGKN
jgi:hypothetical protein